MILPPEFIFGTFLIAVVIGCVVGVVECVAGWGLLVINEATK